MKKLLVAVAAVVAVSFASCGGNTQATEDVDSCACPCGTECTCGEDPCTCGEEEVAEDTTFVDSTLVEEAVEAVVEE